MAPTLLFLATAAVAVVDWVAVGLRWARLEWVCKPLTLALLLAATVVSDLGAGKPWIVAALAFALVGDFALLRARPSRDSGTDVAFLAGLGAFLISHVCYFVAFARTGLLGSDVLAGALIAVAVSVFALPGVLRGAVRSDGPALAAIVASYAGVLVAMTVLAVGTGVALTAVGGVLFLISDTVLARERFVATVPLGPLTVIVTYHLAQLLIVVGLYDANH